MSGSNVVGLDDSVNGAVLSALATSDTLVLINVEGKEVLTYACRTLLVYNVSDILFTEELEGCKNGVGSSLTETAKRVSLDVVAEVLFIAYAGTCTQENRYQRGSWCSYSG